MKVELISNKPREWRRHMERNDKPYSHTRVFVDFNETVLEHLENRRSRPWAALKPVVAEALRDAGIPFVKLSWNRYAGCSMCPCSGGFMVVGHTGHDIWVRVNPA